MEQRRVQLAVSDVSCRQFVVAISDSCHPDGPSATQPAMSGLSRRRRDFSSRKSIARSRSVLDQRTTDLAFRRFMSADGRWLPPMPARYTAGRSASNWPGRASLIVPGQAAVKYGLSIPGGSAAPCHAHMARRRQRPGR